MTVHWPRALAVWWSAAWRGALYGLVGGFVLGAVAGFVAGFMGAADQAPFYGAISGYIASIPASMLGLKQASTRHLPSLVAIAKDQTPSNVVPAA